MSSSVTAPAGAPPPPQPASSAATAAEPPQPPPPPPSPARMPLPRAAADALSLPRDALRLELHVISFSHYCARAKWYLGACGLRADAVHALLPMQHVPHMIALLRRFRAPRAAPTASSKSPAATPALAVYRRGGGGGVGGGSDDDLQPLFLLQDSELIGRWAALRAQALGDGGAAARALYGPDAKLSVVLEEEGEEEDGAPKEAEAAGKDASSKRRRAARAFAVLSSSAEPSSSSPSPAELERRLSGALGVESRRLAYFHLLPARGAMMRLAALNAPPGAGFFAKRVAAPLWALAASLALPRLLGINAPAVERGLRLLDAEFDYLDALVRERGCLVSAGDTEKEDRVGAFLCGGSSSGSKTNENPSGPSAADISLATLAAPLIGDFPGYGARLPLERELPEALRRVLRERYIDRPAARYARALWREYGAAAVATGAGSGGGGGSSDPPPAVAARL